MINVGFIGFGKVSQNLVNLIKSDNVCCFTSKESRSESTIDNIDSSDVEVLPTFKEVAEVSDILISANSPKNSIEVAREYGKYAKGIYLDLNNVSPQTTFEIGEYVSNLVDGAIIGKIDSENPTLYVSGKSAEKLLFLNEFIDVFVVSDKIGDAAILKLLRSSYTKTLSATLIECWEIAKNHNLENEFFDMVSITEGSDFKDKSLSRINNTLNNSKRKQEELDEIITCFDKEKLIMVEAAIKKLNQY